MRSAIINEKQIFNRRVNNENIRLDENLWKWVNKMKTTFREIHIFYHNDDIVDDVVDVDDDDDDSDDSDDSDDDYELYYESYGNNEFIRENENEVEEIKILNRMTLDLALSKAKFQRHKKECV